MTTEFDRRKFLERTAAAGAALTLSNVKSRHGLQAAETPAVASVSKKVRVGVIGCGSVSTKYLPDLANCPFAELVSTCDIKPERAERQAKQFGIKNHYPHISQMLSGA